MSTEERQIRSRLMKVIRESEFLRGTPAMRARVCGKAGCKCARGEKHVSLYLEVSEEGRKRQLFVPKSYEIQVQSWVEHYWQIWNLLERISRLYWKRLQKREL